MTEKETAFVVDLFDKLINFFSEFGIGLTEVMMDEDTGWLMIVCGLMGSIVVLIEKAGFESHINCSRHI